MKRVHIVIIQIPNSLHGSMDKSHVVLIKTESKYRHRQHQETDPTPGFFISRGPNRQVEESYHDPDDSLESRELASHTSGGRRNAMISSTEETHASQPHALPKNFSKSTNGNGMIFLLMVMSQGSLQRKILKLVSKFGTTP